MSGLLTAALWLLAVPGLNAPRPETINFDKFQPGMLPPFWTATGPAQAHWEVRRDSHAATGRNVLAQTSAAVDSRLPLLIYDHALCRDGEISVKFRISPGSDSRSAGLVLRFQDLNNYYLLEVAADRSRISLVRVKDGSPKTLASVIHAVHPDQWYLMKVSTDGNRFRVSFDNRKAFETVDDAIRQPGKAGLSTRGGTIAEFDDFRISPRS